MDEAIEEIHAVKNVNLLTIEAPMNAYGMECNGDFSSFSSVSVWHRGWDSETAEPETTERRNIRLSTT